MATSKEAARATQEAMLQVMIIIIIIIIIVSMTAFLFCVDHDNKNVQQTA
jgi:heme/copper-type cytochrome/quinol oxidase subunit 2